MFIPSVMLIFKEKEWRLFWETKLMAKDTMETAHTTRRHGDYTMLKNTERWKKRSWTENTYTINDQNEVTNMRS